LIFWLKGRIWRSAAAVVFDFLVHRVDWRSAAAVVFDFLVHGVDWRSAAAVVFDFSGSWGGSEIRRRGCFDFLFNIVPVAFGGTWGLWLGGDRWFHVQPYICNLYIHGLY
jgi:hypothetical protein